MTPLSRRYIDRIYLREPVPADSYLSALPAVRALGDREHPLLFPADVTFLVGENGTGKSTLLEAVAVACGFNAEGGTRNFDFSTRATHSPLHEYLTVGRAAYPRDGFFLRAESFYNVATNIDEMDEAPSFGPRLIDSYGGVSLHDQSHGESFLALVEHRFGGNGLYLLDEPEAALSPTRMMSLLVLIRNLVKKHSQFIIATHSPILMAYPGACIYQLSEDGIQQVAYRDTEHYQLTRRFLEAPERMIELLFREETERRDAYASAELNFRPVCHDVRTPGRCFCGDRHAVRMSGRLHPGGGLVLGLSAHWGGVPAHRSGVRPGGPAAAQAGASAPVRRGCRAGHHRSGAPPHFHPLGAGELLQLARPGLPLERPVHL